MTPDEYCDGIIGLAFDRETTKAAFDAGVHEGLRRALRVGAAKSKNAPYVRELVEAAEAVVRRWDSPLWSQQGHTGDFIARLRAALAKFGGGV